MTQMPEEPPAQPVPPTRSIPLVLSLVTTAVVLAGVGLAVRAARRQNHTTLAQSAKFVGVVPARETLYRAEHRYVGAVLAWNEAKLGPQFISGYVTEVRVRPGALVRRGEALAIIEPELAKDRNLASAKQAEAIKARLGFLARESERIQGLEKKGIVSQNDSENKLAEVQSEKAKLEAAQAEMASSDVQFRDTVQRAPFDRGRVICATDAPEQDHPFLEVGRAVHLRLLATSQELDGKISRVSPAADPATRTLHFEVDLDNKDRAIPVGTSVEMLILENAGQKVIQLPSAAAKVEGTRATVFLLDGDKARKKVLKFLGEREGILFLSPDLPPGAQVVMDGREALEDGDPVVLAKAAAGAGAKP